MTYNLHVMLRFGLEWICWTASWRCATCPRPGASAFALTWGSFPRTTAMVLMQDVHWYFGAVGGSFQGYTLGNILGAQFYEAMLKAHPEVPAEIERGTFSTLLGWLRENIYRHGRKYTATELVQRVTGGPMSIEPTPPTCGPSTGSCTQGCSPFLTA